MRFKNIPDPNNPGQRIDVPMTDQEFLAQNPDLRLLVTPPGEFTIQADGATMEIAYIQLVDALGNPVQQHISFLGVLNNGEDTHTLYTTPQGQSALPFVAVRPGRHIISSPDFPTVQVIVNATEPAEPIHPEDLQHLIGNPGFYVIGVRELRYELGVVPVELMKNMNQRDVEASLRGLWRKINLLTSSPNNP